MAAVAPVSVRLMFRSAPVTCCSWPAVLNVSVPVPTSVWSGSAGSAFWPLVAVNFQVVPVSVLLSRTVVRLTVTGWPSESYRVMLVAVLSPAGSLVASAVNACGVLPAASANPAEGIVSALADPRCR